MLPFPFFVGMKKVKENRLLRAIRSKDTLTENGAIAHSTTLSKCLDYFIKAGNPKCGIEMFLNAFAEDRETALRILFWSRDCRGGSGRRDLFNEVMGHLQKEKSPYFKKLLPLIPLYGSWADIFRHIEPDDDVMEFVGDALDNGGENHNLCAKYFPRKGKWFNAFRKRHGMTPKELRKLIVGKSTTVEQLICAGKWNDVNYSDVPSMAGMRYRGAFLKHDGKRYEKYVEEVLKGGKKMNAAVLTPFDVLKSWFALPYNPSVSEKDAVNAQWNSLPNLMGDNGGNLILPICDVSGSMSGDPITVSLSLGCYIAEHNKGAFENIVVTYDSHPTVVELAGTPVERFRQLYDVEWGGDTDLQAVFDLILKRAVEEHVPENDMPKKCLIITDMQFNADAPIYNPQTFRYEKRGTNLETLREKYAQAGYAFPEIIFWNVRNSIDAFPAQKDETGVAFLSGYSPSILKNVLKGKVTTPEDIMNETVGDGRYEPVSEAFREVSFK